MYKRVRVRNVKLFRTQQAKNATDFGRSNYHGENAVVFRDDRGAEEGETHEFGYEADHRGERSRYPRDLRLHAGEEQARQDAKVRAIGLPKRIEDRGHLLGTAEDRGLRAALREVAAVLPAIAVPVCVGRTFDRRSRDGDYQGAGFPGLEAGDIREALLLQRHQRFPLLTQVGGTRDAALPR